ncbi:MAG: ATP synthase F0 subunit C [bacterium JZ-2024 1]
MEATLFLVAMAVSVGFPIAISAAAGAIGLSRAISGAAEGIARQPEAAGRIAGNALLGFFLIEALSIYTLAIGVLLWIKIPGVEQLLQLVRGE